MSRRGTWRHHTYNISKCFTYLTFSCFIIHPICCRCFLTILTIFISNLTITFHIFPQIVRVRPIIIFRVSLIILRIINWLIIRTLVKTILQILFISLFLCLKIIKCTHLWKFTALKRLIYTFLIKIVNLKLLFILWRHFKIELIIIVVICSGFLSFCFSAFRSFICIHNLICFRYLLGWIYIAESQNHLQFLTLFLKTYPIILIPHLWHRCAFP